MRKCAVLAAALWLCSSVALAAEYEVRMPVEKTTRMTPAGELSTESAEPAKKPMAKKSEAQKLEPAASATATKPDANKPDATKPEGQKSMPAWREKALAKRQAKAEAARLEAARPETAAAGTTEDATLAPAATPEKAVAKPEKKAAKPAPVAKVEKPAPAPKPEPKPEPKPAPAPKPKPAPRIDPKALELPPAQAGPRTAMPLPTAGQWAGDVDVEFQTDRVVLRVATSGEVERVTWFNLTDPKEPRKLALDLRGPWRKKGGPVVRFETGPVVSVVTGEHPDRLRLSVEFREGAVGPELTPVVEKTPQGLTLTIPLAVRLK